MEEVVERDMTPKLIGEIYLKKPKESSRCRQSFGIYECPYCKTEWECRTQHIKNGHTKSCGCLHKIATITHGLTKHRFFKTWAAMIRRCTNLSNDNYVYYGGRGIKVCEEWLNVKNFIGWAEATHIEGMTLDRIDNDGNYEPSNCRWENLSTQCLNRRRRVDNKTGFVGINPIKSSKKWRASLRFKRKTVHVGCYTTLEEAVQARDTYIISNNLPHKLSSEYKKELE